ncbi:MAG: glycosyltransferase family 4 protein [Flavobacteriales bacterium]|nr:glycosyltransferase family 4 protein [Flavobacteriales bacterium]
MHVAVLTDGIYPYTIGGMQRHSTNLVYNLLKKDVKITLVFCVGDEKLPADEEVRNQFDASPEQLRVVGLKFPATRKIPGHYIRESYQYACLIYETLKEDWNNFDFIYAKGFTAWCLLEKKKKGKHMAPVGIKFHGYEMYQLTRSLKGKLEQFMLKPPVVFNTRSANIVFSYGGEISNIIQKIGVEEDHIVEIGSGISAEWLVDRKVPNRDVRKFLFIGRKERRKGIGELKFASGILNGRNAEMHWVGPIDSEVKAGRGTHVFHGEVSDQDKLRKIIDSCDVMVVPSHSEGMPNVILEGMARGLAVIATKVGAIPNMVSDENGILIAPFKKLELQNALMEFVQMDESILSRMQAKSLELIREKFLWDRVADQTIDAIRKVTFSQHNNKVKDT